MKKILQKTVLILVVCVLCVSLGGCGALEEMRARHAKWGENGSVLYDGTEYFPIEIPIENWDGAHLSIDYLADPVRLTEPDVPVLLSSFLPELLHVGADGIFLQSYETATVYCRADYYDEITNKLRNGFETVGYCYEYPVYDEEWIYRKDQIYRLTDAEAAALDAVLTTGTAASIPAITENMYDYRAKIMRCDESMIFQEYLVDVYCLNGSYFVSSFDNGTGYWWIWVPEEYNAVFDSMLKVQKERYEEEMSWYEDNYEYEYEYEYEM